MTCTRTETREKTFEKFPLLLLTGLLSALIGYAQQWIYRSGNRLWKHRAPPIGLWPLRRICVKIFWTFFYFKFENRRKPGVVSGVSGCCDRIYAKTRVKRLLKRKTANVWIQRVTRVAEEDRICIRSFKRFLPVPSITWIDCAGYFIRSEFVLWRFFVNSGVLARIRRRNRITIQFPFGNLKSRDSYVQKINNARIKTRETWLTVGTSSNRRTDRSEIWRTTTGDYGV